MPVLDPNQTNSPTRQLKDQILEKLNDIRDKELKDIRDQVLKESAILSEKQRGTSKGFDFEEDVYSTLQTLARPYENEIIQTGDNMGIESKKGDLMVILENKKNIVIECKDSSSYSAKKAMDEINGAIQNRKSAFGIFIFAKKEEMPRELCPIKITDRYLITYYDEDNIYFAFRIARLFALREENNTKDEINLDKLYSEIKILEESYRTIEAMQTKATTIINSGEYLKTNLKILRDNIDEGIRKIRDVLHKKVSEEV
jgi:hypothetical protein